MLPLAYLALTGGTLLTGLSLAPRRPRKRLIDHWQVQPRPAAQVQDLGVIHQTLPSLWQATTDWRKHLRNGGNAPATSPAQPLTAVGPQSIAAGVEAHSEAYTDRYLRVATVSMGVTAVGALAFPLVSILSTPAILYIYFPVAQEAWHGLVKERRLRGTVLDCVLAVGLLVERWFFVTAFAGWLYWAGRKLIFLIQRRTGQHYTQSTLEQPGDGSAPPPHDFNPRAEALVDKLAWPALGLSALALKLHGLESAFTALNCNFIETVRVAEPLATLNYLTLAQQQQIQIYDERVLAMLTTVDTLVITVAVLLQKDLATLQPEIHQVLQQIQARQLVIYLLSDEPQPALTKLAEELGLPLLVCHAGAVTLPITDCASLIEQLQQQQHVVCVVGSAVQDALALQKADVSICVGDESAALAANVQICLTDPTLRQLPEIFRLAQAYQRNLRVTAATAFVPSLICVSGVFFLKYGLVNSVFWYCVSTAAGIGNGLLPLLTDRQPSTGNSGLGDEPTTLTVSSVPATPARPAVA